MGNWRGRTLLAFAVASMMVGACTSGASPSPTSGTGASQGAGGSAVANNGPTVMGVTFPKPEKTDIKVCESAVDPGSMGIYYIEEKHLDQLFGINLSVQTFNGNGPCAQALAAGQVDVGDLSGQSLAFQLTDSPAVDTFVISNHVTDILVGGKNVTDAASLKGQGIAVSSFGSYSYAEALLSIKQLGLTTNDVTLTAVGSDTQRRAALEGGSIGAAIQNHELADMFTSKGFHVLVDLSKVQTAGYVGLALEVPQTFIDKNPNTTLALTAMYMLGLQDFLKDSVDNSAPIWAKYSTEPLDQAKSDISDVLDIGWGPSDGKCNYDTYAFMKTVLIAKDPRLTAADPMKACTNRFTDQLATMGFQKAIGLSGY